MIKYISRRQSVKMYKISESDENNEEQNKPGISHKMDKENKEKDYKFFQKELDYERIHETGHKIEDFEKVFNDDKRKMNIEKKRFLDKKDVDIEKAYQASLKKSNFQRSYKISQKDGDFERCYKSNQKGKGFEKTYKGGQNFLDIQKDDKFNFSRANDKKISKNNGRFHWPRRKFLFEIGFYGMTLITILLLLILLYIIIIKNIDLKGNTCQTVTVIKTRKKEKPEKSLKTFVHKSYPDPSDPMYALCGPCPAPECPSHPTLECSCGDEDDQNLVTVTHGPCFYPSSNETKSQMPIETVSQTPKPEIKTKCLSRDCIIEASEILTSIDEKSDPCKCLYQFACGGMILKKKQIHEKCLETNVSGKELKQSKLQAIFNQLTEEEINNPLSSEIHKFYKSCIGQDEIERKGNRPLMKLIELLGGWPLLERDYLVNDFDLTNLIIKSYAVGAFDSALFKVEIGIDSENKIKINLPNLGLNDTSQYMSKQWRGYFELMIDTALKLGSLKQNAIKSMNDVLQFEAKLAEIKYYEEFQKSNDVSEKISLRKLTTISTKIDWFKVIKQMIKVPINENQVITVQSVPFLKQLDTLLINTNNRIIWNYFIWRVILDAMQHLTSSWRDMYCSSMKISNYLSHAERCKQISFDYFHRLMPLIYYKGNREKFKNLNIRSTIHFITESTLKHIEMLNFFDFQTRTEAINKVKMYRDFLLDIDEISETDIIEQIDDKLRIEEDKYFENILNIKKLYREMIAYSFQINHPELIKFINFKNGFKNDHKRLSIYLFNILDEINETSENTIEYVNFVNIGVKVLQQIKVILFGAKSLPHEKDNSIRWWSDNSLALFSERIACYEAVFNQQIKKTNSRKYVIRINYISEHLSLLIMEEAFNNNFRIENVYLPSLSFSKSQLFYLKLAKIWCVSLETLIHQSNEENILKMIDILFENLKSFNTAFHCSSSFFNLSEINQCSIFKKTWKDWKISDDYHLKTF